MLFLVLFFVEIFFFVGGKGLVFVDACDFLGGGFQGDVFVECDGVGFE